MAQWLQGFPGGSVVKNPSADAEHARDKFDPWVESSPLQYSCLENPRDRVTQWATQSMES